MLAATQSSQRQITAIIIGGPSWKIYNLRPLQAKDREMFSALDSQDFEKPFVMFMDSRLELGTSVNK